MPTLLGLADLATLNAYLYARGNHGVPLSRDGNSMAYAIAQSRSSIQEQADGVLKHPAPPLSTPLGGCNIKAHDAIVISPSPPLTPAIIPPSGLLISSADCEKTRRQLPPPPFSCQNSISLHPNERNSPLERQSDADASPSLHAQGHKQITQYTAD